MQERQHRAEWRVGVYVRAHGHVNHFNREKMLVAFNIRLITDHNEVGENRWCRLKGCGWLYLPALQGRLLVLPGHRTLAWSMLQGGLD